MLSTISFFIIYKDFLKSKGFADHYTLMLIGFGVGDVAGRLSMGIAHSNQVRQTILLCTSVWQPHE